MRTSRGFTFKRIRPVRDSFLQSLGSSVCLGHGTALAQQQPDDQIDNSGAFFGWELQKRTIEAGPKTSLLVSIHLCIWKAFQQRLNFAPNFFGLDSNYLKAGLVAKRPGHRECFGGKPTFSRRIGGGVSFGRQSR